MTSERPYREAMSRDRALAELARCAGTQFDPRVVEAFSEVVRGDGEDGASSPPDGQLASASPGRRPKAAAAAT
jgi:HD-GYP domain-containing protein (c-di-GMP phosphodiesterase class II)